MHKSLAAAVALAAVLAVPTAARAVDFGASLSVGGGVRDVNAAYDDRDFRTALELSPFVQVWIFRIEVPVELQLSPDRLWAVRPGLKLFLPLSFYLRAGYGLGNLGGTGDIVHSLIAGVGKEFSFADFIGILLEGTAEPELSVSGTPVNLMFRAGVFLKF